MKVLTIHSAPNNGDDFCFGVPGEVAVQAGFTICDAPDCGCDRSHSGLNSHKASTVVEVADLDLDFDDVVIGCVGYLEAAGWSELLREDGSGVDDPVLAYARELIEATVEEAARHPVGALLRMNFDRESEQWEYSAV